ncbi:MAG: helix-turn-helix domain-containing protein [Candidatus Binataceae bacterium]
MNRLPLAGRAQIVALLVEGNGINAICRITGVAKNTVLKLLADLGEGCQAYHDEHVHDLKCERIQCDEIWSFCYARAKNLPFEKRFKFGYGDVWTWTAIDADSKLAIGWYVGRRDAHSGSIFMEDVAARLAHRVQLTTDGHHAYLYAVWNAFHHEIDYAMLQKIYGVANPEAPGRASLPQCVGTKKNVVEGNPDPAFINTSYVEKQNQTMRQSMRRFTRLSAGHSKKVENHIHAVAVHFMHYNFGRLNQALGKNTTPAMAVGLTDKPWTLDQIAALSN